MVRCGRCHEVGGVNRDEACARWVPPGPSWSHGTGLSRPVGTAGRT